MIKHNIGDNKLIRQRFIFLKKRKKEKFLFWGFDINLDNSVNEFAQNYLTNIKILNNIEKYTMTKKLNLIFLYINFFIQSYVEKINVLKQTTINIHYNVVIINNKRNQLIITLLKGLEILKSFSTGYIVNYLGLFKKNLRRKLSSFILQIKFLLGLIDKFYLRNFFIFNIIGTKKNFFKWLNFLKFKLVGLKVLVYVYSPSIFNNPIKIKKIKSIKKRLKKKYLYQDVMI